MFEENNSLESKKTFHFFVELTWITRNCTFSFSFLFAAY